MKYSNIGGQAVMEGIMMKNGDHYAVAVRKPDKEIEVKVEECHSFIKNKKILQLPFIRGVFNFVDSLVLGMKSLMFSAEFFMDDEEEEKEREKEEKQRKKGKDPEKENSILLGFTVAFSIVLAVGDVYDPSLFYFSFVSETDRFPAAHLHRGGCGPDSDFRRLYSSDFQDEGYPEDVHVPRGRA